MAADERSHIVGIPFDIDTIVSNSYKDFHAKGVDYICVRRSPSLTVKLYFFDGDASKTGEVVYPHDHRYAFDTLVLVGAIENVRYATDRRRAAGDRVGPLVYNEFEYRTPLNGGNGFTFRRQRVLAETSRDRYDQGEVYSQFPSEIHTIRIAEDRTVLFLRQYADEVPVDAPTRTFARGAEPKLDGLYSRFTPDEVITRLERVAAPLLMWAFDGGIA